MESDNLDIYLVGVGGQGTGLLSEAIVRAADYAGHDVKGVDTHGLAQRGGMVVSQIRIGKRAHSPLIMEGSAGLVIALERHEALRGLNTYLKDGGTLVYFDAVWQPLSVRVRRESQLDPEMISTECARRNVREVKVVADDLEDARMQNIALLGKIAQKGLIPGIEGEDYVRALTDLLEGNLLDKNLALFRKMAVSN